MVSFVLLLDRLRKNACKHAKGDNHFKQLLFVGSNAVFKKD